MYWDKVINENIQALKPVKDSPQLLQRVFELIDLTSLNATDTEASIAAFCEKAQTSLGHVAAVCVYPQFVRLVAAQFAGTAIKAATVVNFPDGNTPLESVLIEIGRAVQDGAQEIDVVFPYQRYLSGDRQYAQSFVLACKATCGEKVSLKMILETGILSNPATIADASIDALTSGADFIKTSTGKVANGATLEAAATMLLVLRQATLQLKRNMGIKISGGVREIHQAAQYIELADNIMGKDWVTPATFRIGASQLVDQIIKAISV